jgi:uncharacterized membrane protein YphA (DoxX/SURF4 family)
VFARLALATGFLAAVADRFGFWGPYGSPNASWGDFTHFIAYTARVNSFLPAGWAPFLALVATVAELSLGLALLFGIWLRVAAAGGAILLLMFASAMTVSFGIKQPLNYSVFSATAAALLLFVTERPVKRWPTRRTSTKAAWLKKEASNQLAVKQDAGPRS